MLLILEAFYRMFDRTSTWSLPTATAKKESLQLKAPYFLVLLLFHLYNSRYLILSESIVSIAILMYRIRVQLNFPSSSQSFPVDSWNTSEIVVLTQLFKYQIMNRRRCNMQKMPFRRSLVSFCTAMLILREKLP